MKKNIVIIFVFFLSAMMVQSAFAQKTKKTSPKQGHELKFLVKDAKDSILYLAVHFRDKLILKDSVRPSGYGKYIFAGDTPYQDGLYMLINQNKRPYLNFVIDKNQHFAITCDTTGGVNDVIIVGSPENVELLKFQQKSVQSQKRVKELRDERAKAQEAGDKELVRSCNEQLEEVNKEMEQFINDLIDANPDYLFSKMQKAYKMIEVPAPPVKEDGTIDSNFQAIYYRTHYWDNVDLSDGRLLYTPALEPKINEYFLKILFYQESDTICKYVDMVLDRAEKDSVSYRFFLEWISYKFESSKILGHDAVFVHIVKNNQLKNKATWMDEDLVRKYEKRVKNLEPLLIGKTAVELIIPDTTQSDDFTRWYSSYGFSKPYVILWFYDPDCPTCTKETMKMKVLYDSLERAGMRNFDIYGVAAEKDINRWKKYLKEKQLPWLNVGGLKANVDYMSAYNIYETGTPSMFIMDNRTRKIILNKRIDMEQVPEFLRHYEKVENYKKQQQQKK
jgi:hypothetical protein